MNAAARIVWKSQKIEWQTDAEVYAALHREFSFDYDPCPIDATEDGLAELFAPWHGRRAFINPGYGRGIERWLRRARKADLAVFLLPARTDTAWFHWCLKHATEIRFVRGRLKFGGAENSAPFPSVVIIFDNRQPTNGGARFSATRL